MVKINVFIKKIVLVFSVFFLTNCADQKSNLPPQELGQPSLAQVSDAAADQIAEAAGSVSQSLTNLEAVEKANMQPKIAKQYPYVARINVPGFSSVDWNGPIEPLVRQVANAAHYHLHIIGSSPIPPIIVTLHELQTSNADILRSAALQAGTRATIKANAETRVIELHYLRG